MLGKNALIETKMERERLHVMSCRWVTANLNRVIKQLIPWL